jgi:hypothetical protein
MTGQELLAIVVTIMAIFVTIMAFQKKFIYIKLQELK